MSSVESLRDFVTERLTAAAEEIFRVFKQTVVEYEEEIGRQRRLLDTVLKPEIRLHRTELPQQHASQEEEEEEEVLSSLEQEQPEPPQIKEEEEEVGRQRRLLDMLPQQHASQEEEEVLSSLEQEQPEPPQIKEEAEEIGQLPQQHVCQEEEEEEEEALSSLEQEQPEPPQIKEEEEEVCSSQEGEQLLLKQETDSLMVTPTHEGNGRCGRVSEKHLSVDEAAMSSVESLRDFVTERLTAAAEEIFRVFKQTVVEYEEEIGRQRRLLDTVLKPEIRLHRT
ncbi:hypothetical protein INR49_016391, partial [Caranx melampygus]